MPRPLKKRNVAFSPQVTLFIPSGVPRCRMDSIDFRADELEALRLTDMEGMYQGKAAEAMGVSRQTLGNILCGARRKVSEALTMGKAIRIIGGGEDETGPGIPDGCGDGSGGACGHQAASGCGGSFGGGCGAGSPGGCSTHQGQGCRDRGCPGKATGDEG